MSRDSDYDKFLTIFSQDGRLYQIEYAFKAVKAPGITTIGLRGKDCVVIATQKKVPEKLIDPSSVTNIFKITPKIGCVITGLHADGVSSITSARQDAESFQYENGYPIPCASLASRISEQSQVNTQHAGARTMGTDLIICAVDDEQGPQLYKIDPSGQCFGYQATASGEKDAEAISMLERKVKEQPNPDYETTVQTAIMVLQQTLAVDFKPDEIEVGVVRNQDPFRKLNNEEIDNYLQAIAERD